MKVQASLGCRSSNSATPCTKTCQIIALQGKQIRQAIEEQASNEGTQFELSRHSIQAPRISCLTLESSQHIGRINVT